MFGSSIIDVAIGLFFVYFIFSVLSSALKEWISGMLGLRANTLEAGIRSLLDEPSNKDLAEKFFNHGLIQGLGQTSGGKPSYIPSPIFATALLDALAPDRRANLVASVTSITTGIRNLPESRAKTALLAMTSQAGMDINRVRTNIETWFDQAMVRLSGRYKRMSQLIIAFLAFTVTIGLNADSYMIANRLMRDSALKVSVVAAATEAAKQSLKTDARVNDALNSVNLAVPLGWSNAKGDFRGLPSDYGGWAAKVAGLLATAIAVSLGAPFWFDLLNALVNLRATGAPPKKSASA